jgi:molybdopterin molybdotransferase
MAPMRTIDEALDRILEGIRPLGSERLPVQTALGRVLAEPFHARFDLPPCANSAMDGYAVRAADLAGASEDAPVRLSVVGTVAAGALGERPLAEGEAYRIFTGAPVPPGADAVVMQERTRAGEGGTVALFSAAAPGENVRPRGDDVRAGTELMAAGTVIGPAEIAALVSHARTQVQVHRRPRVAVFSTGDELVPPDGELSEGRIVDSNGYALAAACEAAGAEATLLGRAKDDPEAIGAMIDAASPFDMLVASGGVSVGDYDHVRPVLEEKGLEGGFWKVAMKPGKPVLFGHLRGRPVFGLPGNPVSALVTFNLFARPVLRRLAGHEDVRPPTLRAILDAPAPAAKGRTHVVWTRLTQGADGGWIATPLARQGSHRIAATLGAHGLIAVAPDTPMAPGDEAAVWVLALPGAS